MKNTMEVPAKDHGIVRVQPAPEPKKQWIPKALQSVVVIQTGGMTWEEEAAKYGVWKLKAVKTCRVYGRQIEIGETFQVPGNAALNFAYDGDAEFVDEDGRRKKEEELAKATAELAAPVRLSNRATVLPIS